MREPLSLTRWSSRGSRAAAAAAQIAAGFYKVSVVKTWVKPVIACCCSQSWHSYSKINCWLFRSLCSLARSGQFSELVQCQNVFIVIDQWSSVTYTSMVQSLSNIVRCLHQSIKANWAVNPIAYQVHMECRFQSRGHTPWVMLATASHCFWFTWDMSSKRITSHAFITCSGQFKVGYTYRNSRDYKFNDQGSGTKPGHDILHAHCGVCYSHLHPNKSNHNSMQGSVRCSQVELQGRLARSNSIKNSS